VVVSKDVFVWMLIMLLLLLVVLFVCAMSFLSDLILRDINGIYNNNDFYP